MTNVTALIPDLPKRRNMSADLEKTKERCLAAWKGLKNVQKNEVLELAGVTASTIHKTYKQGHVSAAAAIALAKVAGLAPLYLCGEADRPGRYTERTLGNFLTARGLANPFAAEREEKKAKGAELEAEDAGVPAILCEVCGEPEDDGLDAEDLVILLEALIIRACYRDDCAGRLQKITELLLED
ncbi:MAG: hypothetical protein FWG93_02525 [Oscillospiraceae bacterium]|nr:hypothetical protein [Oscillospiraceae bacterium]